MRWRKIITKKTTTFFFFNFFLLLLLLLLREYQSSIIHGVISSFHCLKSNSRYGVVEKSIKKRKDAKKQRATARETKKKEKSNKKALGKARILIVSSRTFCCWLSLEISLQVQVCSRPCTVPQIVRGPRIFDRSVCPNVPGSKVHHRHTTAPFFMTMCVRAGKTKDPGKTCNHPCSAVVWDWRPILKYWDCR